MNIKECLEDLLIKTEIETINPKHLTFDSKEVLEETLFVCKGVSFKRDYLLDAIKRGAIAYVSEIDYEVDIPLILVTDIRQSMIHLGSSFYHSPQNKLKIIGITGTKGKTTTTYLLKHIFGDKMGLISSIETFDGETLQESLLTTPEYLDILKIFKKGADHGLKYFVSEVSSQALKVDRVSGLQFEVGVFLNISPDHISSIEHPDFDDYFNSKLKLFKQSKGAIINLDSDYIDKVLEAAQDSQQIITFSTKQDHADYYATDIVNNDDSISFKVNGKPFVLGMTGSFNVENALAAIAVGEYLGLSYEEIKKGLEIVRVPGRMEFFMSENKKIKVIVDYAHNTLSFERLFESTKENYPNHDVFIIFGCPGGKALNRRQDLGQVANRFADHVFLCSEDPNYDEPSQISKEVQTYLTDVTSTIIDDRQEALQAAIEKASKPTVILFTGKGDETYQKIKGEAVLVDSDVTITKNLLKQYNKDR